MLERSGGHQLAHFQLRTVLDEILQCEQIKSNEIQQLKKKLEIASYILDLKHMIKVHKITYNPGNFEHYKECCWSNPNNRCGPDTCICSHASGTRYRILMLLQEIENANRSM